MKRTGEIELSSSHSMALARHTRRYGEEAGRIRRQEFLERLKRTRYPDHLIAGGGLSLSLTIMILVFAVIAILGVSGN
ncbi:MAG: hypothetical protein OEV06_04165 [Anaerolineae bacterium]|nr:hypothetical protein [Anaerolineae bacterium]